MTLPAQSRPATEGATPLPREQAQVVGDVGIPAHFIPKLARFCELKQLQDYFDSKQYEGRPDFWTGIKSEGETPVPLRERAPCIVYPLPRNAVRQTVRFMLGEERWPALRVEHAEGDEGEDEEPGDEVDGADRGLSEADAEALKKGLDELVEKSKLKTVFRRIVERGLAARTAVAVLSLKRGRFVLELPHARDCWPTFEHDDPSLAVTSMTWAYRFKKQVVDGDRLVTKMYWFRRDYSTAGTAIYAPVEDKHDGSAPAWGAPRFEAHELGFCPVFWFRNGDFSTGDVDGFSLYDGLLNEFDALNLALSQRHRGIHYFGTPQGYETGVEPGDGPEATGRKVGGGYSPDDGGKAPHGRVAAAARKKGPDQIWSYQGENVKLGLVETSGAAFETTTKHVDDVRARALEAMGVVIYSINESASMGSSDMSAKLLRLIYAPLLALVADLRTATWGPALVELLSAMVRMVVAVEGRGVRLRSASALARIGRTFLVPTETGVEGEEPREVWSFPDVGLAWGASFESSPSDVTAGVSASAAAKEAGFISSKTGVEYVAPFFGVKDTEAELKGVDRDRAAQLAETVKHEAKKAAAVAAATPQPQPQGPAT